MNRERQFVFTADKQVPRNGHDLALRTNCPDITVLAGVAVQGPSHSPEESDQGHPIPTVRLARLRNQVRRARTEPEVTRRPSMEVRAKVSSASRSTTPLTPASQTRMLGAASRTRTGTCKA